MKRSSRKGQGLVEGALVFLIFAGLLIGAADCGQVVFAHQSLVERANQATRWATLHPWQGYQPVVNMVLYGQPEEPRETRPGFLGLSAENVVVRYQPATPERPDDETVSVSIINYESHFFSPWLARTLVSTRPVLVSAPMPRHTAMLR